MIRAVVSTRSPFALAFVAALAACKGDHPPPGVTDVQIDDARAHYAAEGWFRLEPPVHLPTSAPAIDQVEIWMRLPPSGTIEDRPDEGGLWFPAGTVADRVEFAGTGEARHVVDIRGATIRDDGGQDFHVYRPAGGKLIGESWSRDDASRQGPATDRLLARLAAEPPWSKMPADQRERALADIRAKNACLPCHTPGRAPNDTLGEHGLVNRGTDASGFFTPATVLRDEVRLETYGVDDRSTSDPALELRCDDRPASTDEIAARRCEGGRVMVGRIDWPTAWTEDADRSARVCKSRKTLIGRMDPKIRANFAGSLSPCDGRPE